MSLQSQSPNFSDMTSWLRADFEKDKYTVSDMCDIFPYLPVDLFCMSDTEKGSEYWFVLVASIDDISDYFQQKLLFYQYYISLEYKPSEYKIVLAVSETAKVEKTPYYAEKEQKEEDFYEVNGFGLWTISGDGKIDKKTYPAITLSDKIARDYRTLMEKEKLKKGTPVIHPEEFADGYIHFAVKGIVEHSNIKFEERYIDSKLLEKVLKLKNISYKDSLYELVAEHLSRKSKTDFDFCTYTFNKLWLENLNDEIYPEEHKRLETLLVELYPKYRDHYIHQLQVFLLGLLIIDLIDENRVKSQNGFPDLAWLLAASFHDFAYPIQKYDDYVCRFANRCLGTTAKWSFLGLKNDYHEQSFSSNIEHILFSLMECFPAEDFKGQIGTNNFNKIRQFFYHEITEVKNHGLVASLGLIKKFENNPNTDFNSVVLPAAVAIALHDDEICQNLHGVKSNEVPECVSLVQELAPLHELSFEVQPLAFLLILCDNIQDWGRHYKDEKFEKQLRAANIRLKDVFFNSDTLTIQLLFSENRESLKFMARKQESLETIEELLTSPDIRFVIEYWNRAENEPTSYRFQVGGKEEASISN